MEETKKPESESIYIQAFRNTDEYQRLAFTRQKFLECFLILFIINDYVKESNSFFAEKYMCSRQSIERYFSDLREAGIIHQNLRKPFYEGGYHTERVMWLDSLLKAKIIANAREIRGNVK